ncbi:MAG: M1 family metallopeptidase [Clostridia bacterium]|nr:M1 family metallopeptidase [Clostridia bacterium]
MKVFFIKKDGFVKIIIITLILIILFVCINIFLNTADKNKSKQLLEDNFSQREIKASEWLNEYFMDVVLDTDLKKLDVMQKIKYVNNEGTELESIYFHLYPNAYKSQDTAPFEEQDLKRAYPNGFNSGHIKIDKIEVNGKGAKYSISGQGETILELQLKDKIKPLDELDIDIKYIVKLPNSLGRFGYGDFTINSANWYPVLCVYDDTGWSKYPYYAIGDPFYSHVANYNVKITAPSSWIIASTGNVMDKKERGDLTTWDIKALAVRDFAFIASDKFMVSSKSLKDIQVHSYYFTKDFGERALKYASDAIDVFNEYFGDYPYGQFSVVQTDFFIGGMEYPNVVMIDKSLYNDASKFLLEYVIAHETAHQWWYSTVGNNEIEEAWLDESLTEYSTMIYFEQVYGKQMRDEIFKSMIVDKYDRNRAKDKEQKEIILKPVDEFENMTDYDSLVYAKGAMMLDSLRKSLGDDVFKDIMMTYYRNNAFGISSTQEFIDVCEQVSGQKLDDFFTGWLMDD